MQLALVVLTNSSGTQLLNSKHALSASSLVEYSTKQKPLSQPSGNRGSLMKRITPARLKILTIFDEVISLGKLSTQIVQLSIYLVSMWVGMNAIRRFNLVRHFDNFSILLLYTAFYMLNTFYAVSIPSRSSFILLNFTNRSSGTSGLFCNWA